MKCDEIHTFMAQSKHENRSLVPVTRSYIPNQRIKNSEQHINRLIKAWTKNELRNGTLKSLNYTKKLIWDLYTLTVLYLNRVTCLGNNRYIYSDVCTEMQSSLNVQPAFRRAQPYSLREHTWAEINFSSVFYIQSSGMYISKLFLNVYGIKSFPLSNFFKSTWKIITDLKSHDELTSYFDPNM